MSALSSGFTRKTDRKRSWGGLEVVIPAASKNKTQVKAFMKEISTDGNVNTLADLLPKSFPAFYALAPEYMRLLLEPVMQYSLVWPANYAVHDLGKRMHRFMYSLADRLLT